MPNDFDFPHEWAREEDGSILYVDNDTHGGPECLRCGGNFCQFCNPDVWTDSCQNQDDELVAPPFTPTQMNARLRHLNRLGYSVRDGVIVGKRDAIKKCKPEDHKWTPYTRHETGEGANKRVYKTSQCVICYETKRG